MDRWMEWNGSKAFKGDLAIKEAKGEAGRGPKDSGQNRIGTFRRVFHTLALEGGFEVWGL
jgi:hypothetical protein